VDTDQQKIIMAQNQIGLDKPKAEGLAQQLNELLANYQVFYMNARGFHWNITGEKFFELHAKFEELYNDLVLKVDEVAERILTLGQTPVHSFTEYTRISRVKEAINVSGGTEAIRSIVESLQTVIGLQRTIMQLSQQANDEGTSALMSDYIRQQEKMVWMYSSYLK
jgi:starvation-inducible DNA-binding protein